MTAGIGEGARPVTEARKGSGALCPAPGCEGVRLERGWQHALAPAAAALCVSSALALSFSVVLGIRLSFITLLVDD